MAFGDLVQDENGAAALAYGSDVTSGNLLVCFVFVRTVSTVTVTDTRGNTYIKALSQANAVFGDMFMEIWYAVANGTGACTQTVAGASQIVGHAASEYAGPWRTDPLDTTSSASGASGILSSGSATAARKAALYLGYLMATEAITVNSSGWTVEQSFTDSFVFRVASKLQTTIAADAITTSTSVGNYWTAAEAVFVGASVEVVVDSTSFALTFTDLLLELASSTTAGLVFDYVLAQETAEAVWPSRMTQMADWAVPAYIDGERVVLYTKSGSSQIWVLGNDDTGTLETYIDLPWISRQDDTKVVKWLGLVAPYSSKVAVDVYVRYANNPGEFEAATWTLRGTLPANPTIAEGARIGFGGSTRWVQVRFKAATIAAGGFELFPPIHLIPVDTLRSPN